MKWILIFLLINLSFLTAYTQDTTKKVGLSSRIFNRTVTGPPDTTVIAYDEQGNALHYYQYRKLMQNGEYKLTTNYTNGPSAKTYLKKLTPEEIQQRNDRLRSNLSILSPLLQVGKELDINPLLDDITKEELDKKAIVLLFWTTQLPLIKENFTAVNDILKQVSNPDDMVVIAVTFDNEQKVAVQLMKTPLAYARQLNNARKTITAYQLKGYPSYLVTDKNHIIRYAATSSYPAVSMPSFKTTLNMVLAK